MLPLIQLQILILAPAELKFQTTYISSILDCHILSWVGQSAAAF